MTDSNFEVRNNKRKICANSRKVTLVDRSQGLIDLSQGKIEKYRWISLEARTRDNRL